jgi:hypothetical protein
LSSISRGLELGFNELDNNIPAMGDPGYNDKIREMPSKIIISETLVTYLTATNICDDVVRVTAIHSVDPTSSRNCAGPPQCAVLTTPGTRLGRGLLQP